MSTIETNVKAAASDGGIAALARLEARLESLERAFAAAPQTDSEAADVPVREWPVTIDLKYPVDLGNQRIESLTFRRGRAGDIKGMQLSDKVPTDQLFTVASRMCGQTVKVIEMLDADDASEVIAIALDFFGKCLGGGRKG